MAYLNKNQNIQKFLPKITIMDPYQVYVSQVSSSIETLRNNAQGQEYIPPQLGGVFGQRDTINAGAVLQLTTFEIK